MAGWAARLIVLSIFTTVLALVTAIYRITWHPLARFPGPFWAKITGWYGFATIWKGDNHINLLQLHQKYGNVVRTGPNRLSFRSPQAFQDLHDRKANVIKTGFTDTHGRLDGATLQSFSDKKVHAQRRRILSHAFSDEALRSSESFVINHIRSWCSELCPPDQKTTEWSEGRNMAHWSTFLTLDIMSDRFGQPSDFIKTRKHEVPHLIILVAWIFNVLSHCPVELALTMPLAWIAKISAFTGLETIFPGKAAFGKQVENTVRQRLQVQDEEKPAREQRKDFFHYLLNAKDPETGSQMTMQQLTAEIGFLLGAGSDPSATAMSACLFYLAHNTDKLRQVQQEIRSTFRTVEEIRSGSQLHSLRYLRACLDEGLRMSPPAAGDLNRIVQKGGAMIDNQMIPEGTTICAPLYALQHNESFIKDPWSFKPERWLAESEQELKELSVAKEAFHPFSLGPRTCIGKNVAYMDMTLALARLIYLCDMRLDPTDHTGEGDASLPESSGRHRVGEYQIYDYMIAHRSGPVLQFRRNPDAVEVPCTPI